MESKKEQIKYLQEKLDEAIKFYLLNEIDYRIYLSNSLGTATVNPGDAAKQNQAKAFRELGEKRIRHFRGLIKEIQDGQFIV